MSISKERREQLCDEFQKFAEAGIWEADDGFTKFFGIGNVADFWLGILDRELEEQRKFDKEEILKVIRYFYVKGNVAGMDEADAIHKGKRISDVDVYSLNDEMTEELEKALAAGRNNESKYEEKDIDA